MNPVKSFYLECLRIIAAFYVFIYHIGSERVENQQYLSNKKFVCTLGLKYATAHCFVMIFFVLSGYLITISASKPNMSFKLFITNRLGRLYSVLIPAMFFSFLVAYFFKYSNYDIGIDIKNLSFPIPRLLLNLSFLGQAFTLCSTPPFNEVFWSVQYEFIYYLLFGVFVLMKNRCKYLILMVLLFISWIKILLLLPIWLMGSFLFFFERKIKIKKTLSIFLFLVSSLSLLLYLFMSSAMPFQRNTSDNILFSFHLFFSWNFRADYLFGFIVFINMYSFFQVSEWINYKIGNSSWFRNLYKNSIMIGNCTYTLYLFHTPLLFLYATILPFNRFNNFHIFFLIILVGLSVYFIARYTEWKVKEWRNRIEYIFNKIITLSSIKVN